MVYNDAGSQSCAAGVQTGATMSYDNLGRLTSWTGANGLAQSEQYHYDNEGNWVLRRSNTTINGVASTTDTITVDALSEVSITGGVSTVTNYYSVADQRVAMRKGAILSYLMPDFLSSDSIALNSDGSVQAVQLFAPYGSVRYADQIMPTDYSFTGQRADSLSELLYDNARYYDPVSGRFISADTVQNNTNGMDPYAYVGDNPETKTDPTGHVNDPGTILVGAWYQLLHPGQQVVVDSYDFTIPNAAVFPYGTTNWRQHIQSQDGYPGKDTAGYKGIPDIVNVTSKVMWEVKTWS